MTKKTPHIALAHDYLREYGGAERVVEALHELYPSAPLYTAFTDPKATGIHWQHFQDWQIHESWLASLPFIKKLYSPLRVFADKAFASFDLSAYDVVISSSNAYEAKAVQVPNGLNICYCHTPPRALYGYPTMTEWQKNPVIKIGGILINHYMRVIDYKVAQRVDYFIANSRETARRIKKYYRRDSTVIYPPVEVPTKSPSTKNRDYYLYVNRLGFSKHPELAVQACSELNLPLKVVGEGPLLPQLKAMAGPSVEFLGFVDDEELHKLYAGAKALLYPVKDEDFGIVPVEAMGHGVPVIAHRSGGPKETVIEGKTGLFFDDLTTESLIKVMQSADDKNWNHGRIHKHAKKFSKARFRKEIERFVDEKLDKFGS